MAGIGNRGWPGSGNRYHMGSRYMGKKLLAVLWIFITAGLISLPAAVFAAGGTTAADGSAQAVQGSEDSLRSAEITTTS